MDQENEKGVMQKEESRCKKKAFLSQLSANSPEPDGFYFEFPSLIHWLHYQWKESTTAPYFHALYDYSETTTSHFLLYTRSLVSFGFFPLCDPPSLCWMALHTTTPRLPLSAASPATFTPSCPQRKKAAATAKYKRTTY